MARDQKRIGGITPEAKDTGTKDVANKLALMGVGPALPGRGAAMDSAGTANCPLPQKSHGVQKVMSSFILRTRICLAVASCLLLAECNVGPKYSRPPAQTP